MSDYKTESKKNSVSQNLFELANVKLPCPLCIVEDRYAGTYSGASFLAFNMEPGSVWQLPVDAGDLDCEAFWNNEDPDFSLEDYVIGKGKSPEEALQDLIAKLTEDKKRLTMYKVHDSIPYRRSAHLLFLDEME